VLNSETKKWFAKPGLTKTLSFFAHWQMLLEDVGLVQPPCAFRLAPEICLHRAD